MIVRRACCWLLVGLSLAPAGCATTKKQKSREAVEAEVTESFVRLQAAIDELRKGETENLWDLLAERSVDEATKKAKAFRADFAKRDKEEQEEIAQELGATADEIRDKLSPYGYFRIQRNKIYERYLMVVAAEVDHVKLAGDEATVYYVADETNRDKKPIDFVREDGRWRAILSIP